MHEVKRKMRLIIIGIILFAVAYGIYSIYQINNPEILFNNSSNENKEVLEKTSGDDNKIVKTEPLFSKDSESEQEEPYKFQSERVNILLLGIDASTERYETMKSFRTDTIMLASINFNSKMAQIISIPRDSYVEIPGQEQREKINAAFARGGGFQGKGFEKTMQTVSHFFGGIPIDHYVAVDMNVVKEIIDIMGGLDYEVDVEVSIAGRTLKKGFQHLNGQQVLDYARTRHTGRGDIDRIDRQQRVVLAIFDQLKSTKQISKIPEIYSAVMDKVHTNMNLKQIAALALFGAKLERENIKTYTVPGGFINLGGISYWGVDQYKKKELVSEIFGMDIDVDSTQDIKYLKEKMEEEKKIWMEAVKEGQAAINVGNGTLTAYGEAIKEDEKAKLENHIRLIMDCIDEGDIEGIYTEAQKLHKQNDIILPLAIQRHNAIQTAQAILADVSEKVQTYQNLLLEEEKTALQGKIEGVKQGIAVKEVQKIEQAVEELKSYANGLFNSCQQRQSQQEAPQQQEIPQQQEETSNEGEQVKQQEGPEPVKDETSSGT